MQLWRTGKLVHGEYEQQMKLKLEYRDLLRYGVDHFRHKAGYIPPRMPVSHDWVDELTCTVINSIRHHESGYTSVYWVSVYLDVVCWDCLDLMRKSDLLPVSIGYVFIGSQLGYWQTCELCGNLGIETSLPF